MCLINTTENKAIHVYILCNLFILITVILLVLAFVRVLRFFFLCSAEKEILMCCYAGCHSLLPEM